MVDDYYLNLLDWSSTNLVAIALSDSVYIWNAESGDVGCLCSISNGDETSDEIVCSVRFSEDGSYLAVGTSSGPVQIYDLASSSRVRSMAGHATRVPTLSWNGAVLSSGSRDGSIWNHDVRIERHKIAEMRGHRAEVCGLDWRRDTGIAAGSGGGSAGVTGLLASGGNDNVVNVWDGRMLSAPKMVKTNHSAAVKVGRLVKASLFAADQLPAGHCMVSVAALPPCDRRRIFGQDHTVSSSRKCHFLTAL